MKKLLNLLILCLFSASLYAGTTTVTGTIQDPTAQVFANGTITAQFVTNPSDSNINDYTVGGLPVTQPVTGTMDGVGHFSIIVTDNTTINPGLSQWRFVACPKATVACTVSGPITISGGSIDISTNINPVVPLIRLPAFNQPNYVGSAYLDNEIVNPTYGTTYWNTTSNAMRVFDGSSWANVSAAGAVSSVFGRTGVITAQANDYNYNQLAGTLPVPAVGTRGGVFSKDCSAGGQFVQTISAVDGSETCATPAAAAVSSVFGRTGAVVAAANDYNFNQLAGNIATSQVASGVNADASHFYRGDNTWATIGSSSGYVYNGTKKLWYLADFTIPSWIQNEIPGLNWGASFGGKCTQDITDLELICGYGIPAWTFSTIGTGSTQNLNTPPGASLVAGSTNPSWSSMCASPFCNTTTGAGIDPTLAQSFQMVIKSGSTVDGSTVYRIGLVDTPQNDPPTNGIYIEKKLADTQWFLTCRASGVESRSAAIATVSTSTTFSYVLVITTSRVDVFIPGNAVSQGNCTTNIPVASLMIIAYVKSTAGAGTRTLQVNFLGGVVDLSGY